MLMQAADPSATALKLQAVAKRMASELEDVRLGHVVSKIKYGPDGVEVFCTNGQSFAADAAILTVSLGILKVCVYSIKRLTQR